MPQPYQAALRAIQGHTPGKLTERPDPKDLAAFARYPGVRGCMTKMLDGDECGELPAASNASGLCYRVPAHAWPMCSKKRPHDGYCRERTDCAGPSRDAVARARRVLKRRFAFVGITELWDLSTCLFHRLLGGAPREDESRVSNAQHGAGARVAKYEAAFVDVADELLFASVLDRFTGDVRCVLAAMEARRDTTACAPPPPENFTLKYDRKYDAS